VLKKSFGSPPALPGKRKTNKSKLQARQIDVESKAFVVPKNTPQKRLHESVVNDIRLNSKASKGPTSSAGHNTSSGSALKLLPSAKVYSAINTKVQLVRIALRLDVFSPLAAGATDAETVTRACSCTVKGMRALLEFLHSIHLLIKEGNTYALTLTAATFLVPGKSGYAGELLLMETDPQLWEGVLQALRSSQPVHPSVPWEQDAWLESYRAWRPA
jgi:hypothetical protein